MDKAGDVSRVETTDGGPEEQLFSDSELGEAWGSTMLLPGEYSMVRGESGSCWNTVEDGRVIKDWVQTEGGLWQHHLLYNAAVSQHRDRGRTKPARQRPASCIS